MIWYGFTNEEDPVICEDMFEGTFEELVAHSEKEGNRNRYYVSERQAKGRRAAAVEKFLFERAKGGRKEERKENAIERLFRAVEGRLYREGNGRDPDLRDALNEAIAEYERAKVHGIAITPGAIRQIDAETRSLADQWYTYLNSEGGDLPDMDIGSIRSAVGLPLYEGEMLPDEEAVMVREMGE